MEMVRPVRMAAVGRSGETTIRYGAQYDQQSTDALFQQVANLLVEALSDGGEMSPVSQWEWRTALTSPPSLYFDLMEGVPLSVLTGWLTGESTGGRCSCAGWHWPPPGDRCSSTTRMRRAGSFTPARWT